MITKVPSSPLAYGLPKPAWRANQREAIQFALESFESGVDLVGLDKPTGTGKSLVAMALAQHFIKHYTREDGKPTRVKILVGTNVLLEAYERDFAGMVVIIKGMGNYTCQALAKKEFDRPLLAEFNPRKLADPKCNTAPCLAGHTCHRRKFQADAGCDYFVEVDIARNAPIVCTNYSYDLLSDLGEFDLVICDEAHGILSHLDSAAIIEHKDVPDQWMAAREWARDRTTALAGVKTIEGIREREKLARIVRINNPENWVYSPGAGKAPSSWSPIKLTNEADVLLMNAKRVVLLSATLSEGDVRDLVATTTRKMTWVFREYASPFPAYRRPLIHIPMMNVSMKLKPAQRAQLFASMDELVHFYTVTLSEIAGTPMKGIIHSASYGWAKDYYEASKYKRVLMFPERASEVQKTVDAFKAARQGVLLSPSVTTGLDFPGNLCRFQIILKMPFPSMISPLVKARTEIDKSYGKRIALSTVTQALGRGMRSIDDWCDTIILDSNLGWVLWSTPDAQRWVKEAYRKASNVESWIKMRRGEKR